MIGGWCFLIGTLFFWKGPIQGDVGCEATCGNYIVVLVSGAQYLCHSSVPKGRLGFCKSVKANF